MKKQTNTSAELVIVISKLTEERSEVLKRLLNLNTAFCLYEIRKKELLGFIKAIDDRIDKLLK